ncbi:MAG: hypothetical protein JO314_10110, partial [Acidobacteria bacterium]|nr:hypothetical protein [Acidobacteriota bacterium]
MKKKLVLPAFGLMVILAFASIAAAQTTQFTYQGKLSDSAVPSPTNGTYDMQFRLWSQAANGVQLGGTITNSTVTVANGIFTVQLDFAAAPFAGSPVFVEIAVRPAGSVNPYTTLGPRQPVNSAPYAIQSLNSAQLGNIPAASYVLTNDPRLSDERDPIALSPKYIQNTQFITQAGPASFNISGNGVLNNLTAGGNVTATGNVSGNLVNSATQYNIGGNRMLSSPGSFNTFAGLNSGAATNSGVGNSFFGNSAGLTNVGGGANSFFGYSAGRDNTASFNSFFGSSAGVFNSTGDNNAFFGWSAGSKNTTGATNSFFGSQAGNLNTTGSNNSFVGTSAGSGNTTGSNNAFSGTGAGSV